MSPDACEVGSSIMCLARACSCVDDALRRHRYSSKRICDPSSGARATASCVPDKGTFGQWVNGVHSATLKHGRVPTRRRVFHAVLWHSVEIAARQHGTLHMLDVQTSAAERDQGLRSAAQSAETCSTEVQTIACVLAVAEQPCFHLPKRRAFAFCTINS
jgi:hypothetical protein